MEPNQIEAATQIAVSTCGRSVAAHRIYGPKFPRTVAGRNFRVPLNHFRIERLAVRLDDLYNHASLSDNERTQLVNAYRELRHVDLCLAVKFAGEYFPTSSYRPLTPRLRFVPRDKAFVEATAGVDPISTVAIGYFERVWSYVELLGAKYLGGFVGEEF